VTLQELHRKKEKLIRSYLSLQDAVDEYNGKIYEVCCEIEAVNLMITEEERKQAVKQPAKQPPAPPKSAAG
jgi:hypothetical protein